MAKKFPILALLLFLFASTNAQKKVFVGYLQDSITLFPIADGTVLNVTTNKGVQTDEKGFFKMEASPNDFIAAFAKSYNRDTLNFSMLFKDTVIIQLAPAGNLLPEVIVTTKYNKYQLDSIERRTTFEQIVGKKMGTFSTSHPTGAGLTLNLDPIFKKKYRDQKDQYKMFGESEKRAYVNYRFSPHVVHYFTGLKGDRLKEFINRYTPSYDWLRKHPTNEDVLYYINDKLKELRSGS